VNKFLDDLSLYLEKISSIKFPFYLIEDINIDITLINRSKLAKDYINLLVSHCSLPLITLPTRVTYTSSTIIDHIITNDARHQIKPLVIRENLTDHYPVICSIHGFFQPNNSKINVPVSSEANPNFQKKHFVSTYKPTLKTCFMILPT